MAIVSVKDLVFAGVHFGHGVSRWNPKMKPYIYGKRNLIHIIDLKETLKGIIRAYRFISKVVAADEKVLFVGCKPQAKAIIEAQAKRCGMPFVSERWLGGMLTNFETIRLRINRLQELERMEEEGTMDRFSKKLGARLEREKRKIRRNLGGVLELKKLPGALFVVDPQREKIGVREANKLEIPTVALIDTDSNPEMVDIPIPGNDDSIRAISVICTKIADAVLEGKRGKVIPRRRQVQVASTKAESEKPEELVSTAPVEPTQPEVNQQTTKPPATQATSADQ